MQTIKNIPKNLEHVDNVPKRPENPDCNVQKVYPKFRHVPVWLYRGVSRFKVLCTEIYKTINCINPGYMKEIYKTINKYKS